MVISALSNLHVTGTMWRKWPIINDTSSLYILHALVLFAAFWLSFNYFLSAYPKSPDGKELAPLSIRERVRLRCEKCTSVVAKSVEGTVTEPEPVAAAEPVAAEPVVAEPVIVEIRVD
jgi:hypothetical protein